MRRSSHSNGKKELRDGEESDETSLRQRFFFRDAIGCARFLLGQKCLAEDMVYAPVKKWNCEELPQQVYSEMHTAD